MAFDAVIVAGTVWMEARGEGAAGQEAVAHVINNRFKHGGFGKTAAAVCLAKDQFSCWNTGDVNRRALAEIPDRDPILVNCEYWVEAAFDPGATDPTDGALYYFADGIEKPAWAVGMTLTKKIGKHNFYRP